MKSLEERATELYIRENRFTDQKHRWPPFRKINEKERDYWFALILRSDELLRAQGITPSHELEFTAESPTVVN